MSEPINPVSPPQPRLRVWPAVVIIALQWAVSLSARLVAEESTFAAFMMGMFASLVGALLLLGWWVFASRLRWSDRLLVPLFVLIAAAGSIAAGEAEGGGMEIFFRNVLYALPTAMTAGVLWLAVTPLLGWPTRRAGLLVVAVVSFGLFALMRGEGVTGSMAMDLRWRWLPNDEDLYLKERSNEAIPAGPIEAVVLQPGDWVGFRGADRSGRLAGTRLATDWSTNPPNELWRQRIGPGWGSMTVLGKRLYTQEQANDEELVVCYDADTGKTLWVHRDTARFTEGAAGPGPRATPTFSDGKIYALGAKGMLNCLDAASGRLIWARDVAKDAGAAVPNWGFASSPLVAHDIVTVFAGGPNGKSVMAYGAGTGAPAWFGGEGLLSYCSPQLATLAGVEQILIATDAGLQAFEPILGKLLWKHDWPSKDVARVVQPAVIGDSDVLVGTGFDLGVRRLHVAKGQDGKLDASLVWASKAIKPYYNDLVIHKDHLYGFNGEHFVCVALKDGKKVWSVRGYGHGQVVLLADQNLLLIVSEQGDVALRPATPAKGEELARISAIQGKTWNHPVVAHNRLFVRNGAWIACYELPQKLPETTAQK